MEVVLQWDRPETVTGEVVSLDWLGIIKYS